LFYQGNTDNIFQLESGTAKNILKMIKPDCFEDIAAVSAILRPGPLMAGVDK
jgi:DNA polymerase III subunit alpha